jgi:ADP-ribose pyrophosphatase YjhB (NUDIX family)
MEPFAIIKDADIFEDPATEPKFYERRITVKGVVFDEDGDIAVLTTRGHSLLPGGGVEGDEGLEDAFVRECREEIGCDVTLLEYLGVGFQYRAQTAKKYEVHFFVAQVTGEKGSPSTEDRDEQSLVLSWETIGTVQDVLESQIESIPQEEYATHFNARLQLEAFRKFMEIRYRIGI